MIHISFDITLQHYNDIAIQIGDECIMTIKGEKVKMNLMDIELNDSEQYGAIASLKFTSQSLYLLKHIQESSDIDTNLPGQ